MCYGLYLRCHRQLYRGAMPLPNKIEVAQDLEYFKKWLVTDPTIEVKECKHMQLMLRIYR